MSKVQDERDNPIFIHSTLDDARLDPYAFRLYARYARRAGNGGYCNESQANMAEALQMTRKRLKKAQSTLVNRNMIRVEKRTGETDLVTLTHRDDWNLNPDSSNEKTHGGITHGETTHGENDQGGTVKSPEGGTVKSPDKGTPIEGTPEKEGAREPEPFVEETQTPIDVEGHPAVKAHRKLYPGAANRWQREQIALKVDDVGRWMKALRYWKINGYKGKSVGRQLKKYGELATAGGGDGAAFNGQTPPARPNAKAYREF